MGFFDDDFETEYWDDRHRDEEYWDGVYFEENYLNEKEEEEDYVRTIVHEDCEDFDEEYEDDVTIGKRRSCSRSIDSRSEMNLFSSIISSETSNYTSARQSRETVSATTTQQNSTASIRRRPETDNSFAKVFVAIATGIFTMVMMSNFVSCVVGDNFFLFLIKSLAAFGVYYFVCSLINNMC